LVESCFNVNFVKVVFKHIERTVKVGQIISDTDLQMLLLGKVNKPVCFVTLNNAKVLILLSELYFAFEFGPES
jgi:hypothetical protein